MKIREFWHIYKWIFIIPAVIIGVVVLSHSCSPKKTNDVQVVTPTQLRDTSYLIDKFKFTPVQAVEIQKQIPKAKPVTYYRANTIDEVVRHEKQEQKTNKADKVIVSEQSPKDVAVYRVTLKKEHKVKAGVTVIDNHVYPAVGYQAGRFEAVAHMQGTHLKGATMLYTVAEW